MRTFFLTRVFLSRKAAFLCFSTVAWILGAFPSYAQDTKYPPQSGLIPVPSCLEESWPDGARSCSDSPAGCDQHRGCVAQLLEWRREVFHWRDENRIRSGFNPSEYQRPELQWAQSSFMQPQMMAEDRYFYDRATGKYTVDRYLDDLTKRYGGIDAVLVWQSYPDIGIDNRSQYDLIRALPGGIPALKQMVADFHKRGVRVLFPVMVWDQGTHDDGVPNWESTAKLMAEIGADGINGDTLDGMPKAFRDASDKTGHPIVFEPEGYPNSNEMLNYNNMNWGYWRYPFAPLISESKLIDPRHMVNISDRWNRSKTNNLQAAFINGAGLETWENVWSIWNGITPRGAESIRRVAAVDRAVAPFLITPEFEPLTPTEQFGVFATGWPLNGEKVYTLVNRNEYNLTGPQLELPYAPNLRYYDLWHGVELTPEKRGNTVTLSFEMEAHGYGALLVTQDLKNPAIQALLKTSKSWNATPLESLSDIWVPLPQQLVSIPGTSTPKADPEAMVKIPAADFLFRISGLEIEGDNGAGVDVQYPWEDTPRRHHLHQLHIPSFWIDKYPVTNEQFKKFLDATHYHPRDDYNFLKDWVDGAFPKGWDTKPVTWVSLEDARAYAAWAGKRLPHEWEWQYAAQGNDGRIYPWGNAWDGFAVPAPVRGRDLTSPDNVDAHPRGSSPFGVMDLVGNVWQWTDEYQDEHTRTAVLRGGSYYQPQGSLWYFPQAYRNTEHNKYLLMAPSKDRAGTLGFRCVIDAE